MNKTTDNQALENIIVSKLINLVTDNEQSSETIY
jgi:hypothetical protein